ncbi:MptD family putative ECF transporter S component [Brevibacillus gelatini]|uniref:Trep_Strep domain-containing protein n=1 Tax=Brevibacillus gelatini TaxID=1655277 RepID=A0A3M8B0M7_9BACL|nr:MptD family putative ECF transporter S component [Brevibacillus gelatini]RNB56870.1 Trep_Strep domain-containing protein [Brevibacillus gelatini]
MEAQLSPLQNRWTLRDFITLAIFNVVMLIIITFCPMFTFASYLIVGGITALLNGPLYVVMANKINKRGVLFLSSIITGLYFVAYGYAYFLLVLGVMGIICELVLWGQEGYKSTLRSAIAYALFYVGYSMCGMVPLMFFRDEYIAILSKSYSKVALDEMLYYYGTPSMAITMCLISAAGGLVGVMIGNMLFKKHVKKAKLA